MSRLPKLIFGVCVLAAIAAMVPVAGLAVAQETPAKPAKADAAKGKSADDADDKMAMKKAAEEKPAPLPVSQDPYDVVVNITMLRNQHVTSGMREQLRKDIARLIERTWGGMWVADVRMNDWMLSGEAVERLEAGEVSERFGKKVDKVLFVSIDPQTWSLTAREWDYRSNSMTVPAHGSAFDRVAVPNTVVKLLVEVFQPVLLHRRTDKFDKSYIEVTLKAGAFPAPDPIAAQIRPGDVLTPVVRHFDKRNRDQVKRIQEQTLTYLVVQAIDREVVGGTLLSGVPTIFGKNARRAEQFALRRRPRHPHTKVKLVLRSNPDKPLLCHRVNLVSKLKYRDEELAPSVDFISDRYGEVEVPVGSYPTFWIYVYSGKLLLARIPYAPGLVDEETVLMPDDSMRLLVEGEVDLLKGRLIDLVARRAVHMSSAQQYSRKGKAEETKAEVAALDELPNKQDFLDQITTFRQPAVEKALAAGNRVSRGRIVKVCREIENVLETYFDPARMVAFKEQLENLFESDLPADGEAAEDGA